MTEDKRGFWERLISGDPRYRQEREHRVIGYIAHRVGEGVPLREVVEEEYVRRNVSPAEVDDILQNPALMEAVHQHVTDEFSSGRLDPKTPPSDTR